MSSFARPSWTEQELSKLKELCDSGKYRFEDMPAIIGRTKKGIMFKCYELGWGNNYQTPRKYSLDKTYFSTIGLDQCFFTGCLVTDGSLNKRSDGNGYSLRWSVAVKDRHLLEEFAKQTKCTHPLKTTWNKCQISTVDPERKFENVLLSIHDPREWIIDLKKNFGFTSNKCRCFPPPVLPTMQHKLAFMAGLITGDGTITHGDTIRDIMVSICGINRDLISWFKDTIDSLNLPTLSHRPALIASRDDENCYYYKRTGLSAAILVELLTRLPVYCLERKFKSPKALEIISYWKSRPEWPPESFFQSILSN